MSFRDRNAMLLHQEAIDSDMERLVRENPMPQRYLHEHHSFASDSTFTRPHTGRQMSASANPLIRGYMSASPGPQFLPFRSPQSVYATHPANTSYPSAANIFNSLKNPGRVDNSMSHISEGHEYKSKENNSSAANFAGFNDEFLMMKNTQVHGHDNRNNISVGSNLHRNQSFNLLRGGLQNRQVGDNISCDNRINSSASRGASDIEFGNTSRHQLTKQVGNSSSITGKRNNLYEETFQDAFSASPADEEIDACSLYMWIIKPVPGSHDICVEGKKSLSDDTFWHSGVITRRINEKLVETQTGSVYKLESNMELLDAMAAGFSRKTAEAFWLGFPADWKQLIEVHFRTTQPHSIMEEENESDEEIDTLENVLEDVDGEDTGHDDISVTELATLEDDNLEQAAPIQKEPAAPKSPKEAPAGPMDVHYSPGVKKAAASKQDSKSEIIIENWILKLLPNGKGIHVLGTKPSSGFLWHSTAIEKRIDKRRLMSSSGTTYRLKGKLDKLLALDEGLPNEIISKFSSGFPKEWQELIQEYMCKKPKNKKKSSKSKQKKQTVIEKDKQQKTKTSDKKVTKETPNPKEEKSKKEVKKSKPPETVTAIEKKSVTSNTTPAETQKWTKSVFTPNGEVVDLERLGRSRSGRLIKPPLQWWTGQTLELDGDNISVKAPTVAASMYLQQFEDGFKKSRHKAKSYWNPREKDKDYSINTSKSSLNITVSSVESEINARKKKISSKSSSKTEEHSSQSADDSLDQEKLQVEVKLVLEKAKNKRSKVKQRDTCYSKKNQNLENSTESENNYDLDETPTEIEQESNRQLKKVSKNKNRNKKQEKVEQENEVSSSTGLSLNDPKYANVDALDNVPLKSMKTRSSNSNTSSIGNRKQNVTETNVKCSIRKKTKTLPVITEDDSEREEDFEENVNSIESARRSQRKPMASLNKKGRDMSKKSSESGRNNGTVSQNDINDVTDHWTKEEKDRLREACKNVSPSNPHYWEKVAAEVRTKSEEMCKEMYFNDKKAPGTTEKKKQKAVKEKPKVTNITANVGTLKRKQQLKDLLDQQNENYTDDLFDSTPYRMSRKRKVPMLGGDDDDSIFEEIARKQGKSRFETPVATQGMSRRTTLPFASTKKTPVSNINVEMLEGSEDTDGYVHRIMKRRLQAKSKNKSHTPKVTAKKPQVEVSPQQQLLFHEYLKEKKDISENHHDSDQEEDFYWEDDIEN